ncbi:nicotinate phosphoribosyltransferase, partial [Klebsiella michiganensis]
QQGELKTRSLDGKLYGYVSLSQIRARLAAQR